jgi:hypothetical protein
MDPIVKLWNQARYPSTDEEIKKMKHIYILEYYSVYFIQKNEIILFAEKWMKLEIIMLSEVS